MKKIILPIILLFSGLVSCNSGSDNDYDSYEFYKELYQMITTQNNVAMDPFNVAYRLNIYLEEGETQAIKDKLFPTQTEIKTEDNKVYTIVYAYSEADLNRKDLARQGTLIIDTHGSKLSEENAVWEISTNSDNAYAVLLQQNMWGMDLFKGEYVISNQDGELSWNIQGDQLYLYLYGLAEYGHVSWGIDVNVKQVKGEGLSDDARFAVESGVQKNSGTIMGISFPFRYEIMEPLFYSIGCNYLQKSGGKERLIAMDQHFFITPESDTIVFNFGNNWNSCMPEFSIMAKPDSVWETRHYDSLGQLVKIEREDQK